MAKRALLPEVAAKYKLVGISPGTYSFSGIGTLDLCSMDLALADQLAANGFQFLELKKPVKPSA
jgi:hypothetical protein